MTKDDLIVKQQIEIEDLKASLKQYKEAISRVRGIILMPEQWSIREPEFPRFAMSSFLQARDAIDGL